MEILTFHPIYKERIWGGRKLELLLDKRLPEGLRIGESWEISDHGDDISVVADGRFEGETLRALLGKYGKEILGERLAGSDRFPLLVKFIDANELLSLQVHPDDLYASSHEPDESGKTEMWYVIQAEPGAKLVKGLAESVTRESLVSGLEQGTVRDCLREFEVSAGDAVFVPSGCVHALEAGLVVCEIQQNSDITYRLHDWGRLGSDGKPRQTHVEKALDVIDFGFRSKDTLPGFEVREGPSRRVYLVACSYFAVELLEASGTVRQRDNGSFDVLQVIDGEAVIACGAGQRQAPKGQTLLVPAAVGEYEIRAGRPCRVLRTYVPDLEDFSNTLREEGISDEGDIVFR